MPQVNITININQSIYKRDPTETNLGKKIIEYSIILMDDIGFEEFTFKKLAAQMGSTEASIYRYFDGKYMLLTYLVAWYWDFLHFVILSDIRNLSHPKERMLRIITALVNALEGTATPSYIDQTKLHAIVVENATKVYHTKRVDSLNKIGFYLNFKKLVNTLVNNILALAPDYKYPKALATSIIEQSLSYEYYMNHLPGLTDHEKSKPGNVRKETIEVIWYSLDKLFPS
jgi:hypothetical protein